MALRPSSSPSGQGWCFELKTAVGVDVIRAREHYFLRRAIATWQREPRIEILGNIDAERLSIVSFVVRAPSGSYLHHNFVVALLNDLFGIQSRGGCSCAGPYGHRLLGIDIERSHAFEREISLGCEGIKPGWVRINFNYFISEAVFDYLVEAVRLVARDGWRLLEDYRFDLSSGLWRHRGGAVEPLLRLGKIRYDDDGRMTYPRDTHRAPESDLQHYLAQATDLFESVAVPDRSLDGTGTALPDGLEHLRWFDLPRACLAG